MAHDYSGHEDVVDQDQLSILHQLCSTLYSQEQEIEQIEKSLETAKDRYRTIREKQIPDLMKSLGMKSVTTSDGLVVKIREEVRASQPKEGDPRRVQLFEYLRTTHNEGLIKNKITVQLPRGQEDVAEEVESLLRSFHKYLSIERKQELNHQTMLGFLREQLREGVNIPMDLFGAIVQTYADVRRG